MSYNFDGKIANQAPRFTNYTSAKCHCAKCNKIIDTPKVIDLKLEERLFTVRSYIGAKFYIYETKSGTAVTYCSQYCRDKHNHRFTK